MLDLPMVIHVRDAPGRLRSILEEQDYYNGVLHCFSSDRKLAEWAIEKGLHVSFSGNVTYGDSRTNEILRMVPRERLMIETDAPYLAPVPHRGERNEPAYVAFVAEQVAKLLESDTKTVAELTHDNSVRLFRI
jgi:TatD DNase family protein